MAEYLARHLRPHKDADKIQIEPMEKYAKIVMQGMCPKALSMGEIMESAHMDKCVPATILTLNINK